MYEAIKKPKASTGLDYWTDCDLDQDVMIGYKGQLRLDKKDFVLKCYLEKLQDNVREFQLEEDRKIKLHENFRQSLIRSQKVLVNPELNLKDFKLNKDVHLEQDGAGNYYVSDDI